MLAAAGSTYHVAAAEAEAGVAGRRAAAEAEYQLANARLDAALDKATARAEATRSLALARSQASLWTRTTTLENTRQRLLGQYEATWQASLAGRQSLATAALAQATGSGWAAFQAEYAAARAAAWSQLAAQYAGSIAEANGLSTAYQSAVSAARVRQAEVSAQADLAYADAAAEAQLARRTAAATASKLYAEEVADARKAYRVTVAQDANSASAAAAAFTSSVTTAATGYDSAQATATAGYRSAVSTGQTAWRAGRAAADLAYRQAEAQQYRQWTLGTAAVDEAFRRLAADGESALTSELATTSDSPWADFEADRAASAADWTEAVAPADRARRTAVAEAVFTYDVARATADTASAQGVPAAQAPASPTATTPPTVPLMPSLPQADATALPTAPDYVRPVRNDWSDNRSAATPPAAGAMGAYWGYGYWNGWYGGLYGSYLWDAGAWFNADHTAWNVVGGSVSTPPLTADGSAILDMLAGDDFLAGASGDDTFIGGEERAGSVVGETVYSSRPLASIVETADGQRRKTVPIERSPGQWVLQEQLLPPNPTPGSMPEAVKIAFSKALFVETAAARDVRAFELAAWSEQLDWTAACLGKEAAALLELQAFYRRTGSPLMPSSIIWQQPSEAAQREAQVLSANAVKLRADAAKFKVAFEAEGLGDVVVTGIFAEPLRGWHALYDLAEKFRAGGGNTNEPGLQNTNIEIDLAMAVSMLKPLLQGTRAALTSLGRSGVRAETATLARGETVELADALAKAGATAAEKHAAAGAKLAAKELAPSASNVARSPLVSRILAKINLYPKVIDPRTGRNIVFPSGIRGRVDKALRVTWNSSSDRAAFIAEWSRRGYATPRGGWARYDIHHIQPLEFGGTNDFWNLVPVERGTHSRLFNDFWRLFEGL